MIPSHYTKEKIYDLLPSIYKSKDKKQGEPLKALLDIIGKQVEFIEKDIDLLYQNLFIESCTEDLVPYFGDLLNAKILNPISRSNSSQRSWVANTISYRRRKGTVSMLEQLSKEVTGWNCKVVEFFQTLITTQYVNHVRLTPTATVDMRKTDMLEIIGSPFDLSAHIVDVRHIKSKRGYYNVPNIGLFLWRLQSYPVINAPAFSLGEGRYTFSQLGFDLPLYNYPGTERKINQSTTELDVPAKIRRMMLKKQLELYESTGMFAYDESLKIVKKVLVDEQNGNIIEAKISPEDILVCNLSNWNHTPPLGKVAIDPELGRMMFNKDEKIVDVHVYYYYGFSSDMGGGFYDRELSRLDEEALNLKPRDDFPYHYKISKKGQETFHSLKAAIEKWRSEEYYRSKNVIFEIIDSEIYSDTETETPIHPNDITSLEIDIPENVTVIIKSENFQRPVLRLSKCIKIRGESGSRIIFDGILFVLSYMKENPTSEPLYDNNNIILKVDKGDLLELIITHCTLVPAREDNENVGKLVFSWENIPQVTDDVKRLKMFLSNLINEDWIRGNNVVFNKEGPLDEIITISTPDMTAPPLRLVMYLDTSPEESNVYPGFVVIQELVDLTPLAQKEYQTIYNLPIVQENNRVKVCSSMYSIGIFGNSADAIHQNNDVDNNNDDNENDSKNSSLTISINHSIVGRIESFTSVASLRLENSIVDGKGMIEAIRCYIVNVENTTVFGKTTSEIIGFVSNSIFTDMVIIKRTQQGCLRFCYLSHLSQTPRPFRCLLEYPQLNLGPRFTHEEENMSKYNLSIKSQIHRRIRPQYSSVIYGDDGYSQLHKNIDELIFTGADNGSEMGTFNELYNPQRLRNLSSSLDEYMKFGLEAGIFWVT